LSETALQGQLSGLSAAAAAQKLKTFRPNRIEEGQSLGLGRAFLERFRNPLILILTAAAAVSATTGDVSGFVIITVMVLASIVLDVVQEHRAGNAAAKLRTRVSLTASVYRDGKLAEIPVWMLVPGDLVQLKAGDLVPADGTLTAARDLFVNEALLTGESFPVEKKPATTGDGGALFMGSSIVSGTAFIRLTGTGRNTRLGTIAHSLHRAPPPTAFALGIRDFSRMILRLTLLLLLFTLLVNLAFHKPPLQTFLFAVALAVGLTPELLPMVTSVTLAYGAIRLSRKDVIVKQLSAVHDLGSMDVLCCDKTGTLTEARISLICQVDVHGRPNPQVLKLARLNAQFETGLKSPMDDALSAGAEPDIAGWRKLDEVPFDFERRRISVLVEGERQRLLIVKGAPEDILALANQYQSENGDPKPLSAEVREQAQATLSRLADDGLRTLAVAWRVQTHDCIHAGIGDERELTLAGFLGFLDPPKAGAREALSDLSALGIEVKILTGDSEGVARHVCRALDLHIAQALTGAQIATMSDEALTASLSDVKLFCRVSPPQKLRILSALRRQGHVVGFLGDGINDAPSLHEADIGFSVDSAVDVAKEAANMILLRKDLDVLADGVWEGRRSHANVMKYILMGTSSNFGNMFSMAGASLLLPFLPMLPVQILLNNLLYDLSEAAIPLDRVDPEALLRPKKWDMGAIKKFMLLFGPISSLFDFVTFYVVLHVFQADERLFQTSWFVESIATQVLVIFIIRTARPFRDFPHPALTAASLAAVAVALLLPYTFAAHWLGFTAMPTSLLSVLMAITMVYLVTVYSVRRWFFVRHGLV
jgi:Mg2+-importing ATPase